MDRFSKDELSTLLEQTARPCVSIYMPTERAGTETQQNPIRLKNLIGQAEERLVEGGMRAPEAATLMEPLRRMLDDTPYWQRQSDGLAVFRSPELFSTYRLPLRFDELAVVGNRFHLKPALSVLSGDGRFYVLAISQNRVRLLRGSRDSVSEITPDNLPKSLEDALWYWDEEEQLQHHNPTVGRQAGEGGIFHGHGAGTDTSDDRLREYFRTIDRALKDALRESQAPLVLAGVERLLPMYREANTYAHLVDDGVTGNPDEVSAEALHRQAWQLVEPHFLAEQKEAAAQFHQLLGTGRASNNISEIAPAAEQGRVDTLFVSIDDQRWGRYEPETASVETYDEESPEAEDLLDFAALRTLRNSGTVFALERDDLPSDTPAAAIFRY